MQLREDPLNVKPNFSGVIECFTRTSIRGWVSVDLEGELLPLRLTLEFEGWSCDFEGELTKRFNGLAVGFEFAIPVNLSQLPWRDFVAAFKRCLAQWTWNGRRGQSELPFYKSAFLFALQDAAKSPQRKRKVAVMIRTHVANSKTMHLARQIEAATDVDVYVSADTTNGEFRVGNFPLLSHNIRRFAELGLDVSLGNTMWVCGDYPFYAAALDAPQYDFFLMIEFDVALGRNGGEWLRGLIERLTDVNLPMVDFYAPNYINYSEGRGWHRHARVVGKFEAVYKALFPVIGLSRPAIFHLFAKRLIESRPEQVRESRLVDPNSFGLTYCEVFVPSTLKAMPTFLCATNKTLGLNTETPEFSVNRPLLLDIHRPDDLIGSIAHPVLDQDDYMSKVANFCKSNAVASDWLLFSRSIWRLPDRLRAHPAIEAAWNDPRFVPPPEKTDL